MFRDRWYPWTFLTDRIELKFMREYKESDVAEPTKGDLTNIGLTAKGWVNHSNLAKKNHKFLYKLKESLDQIEFFIERWIERFKKPYYWYVNGIRDKSHVLRTGLKFGEWHDLTERIFLGMMYAVVDFVEGEEGIKYYLECKNNNTEDLKEFPDHQREMCETVNEVYNWFKVTLPALEKELEDLEELRYGRKSHYENETPMEILARPFTPKEREELDVMMKLEENIENQKKEMVIKVAKVFQSMWT